MPKECLHTNLKPDILLWSLVYAIILLILNILKIHLFYITLCNKMTCCIFFKHFFSSHWNWEKELELEQHKNMSNYVQDEEQVEEKKQLFFFPWLTLSCTVILTESGVCGWIVVLSTIPCYQKANLFTLSLSAFWINSA